MPDSKHYDLFLALIDGVVDQIRVSAHHEFAHIVQHLPTPEFRKQNRALQRLQDRGANAQSGIGF